MTLVLAASGGGFWSSMLALVAVALACALVVGVAVAVALARRSRRGSIRARVGEFIASSGPVEQGEVLDGHAVEGDGVIGLTERTLEGEHWWRAFREKVELARFDRSAIEVAYLALAGSIGAAILAFALIKNPLIAAVALIVGPLIARMVVNRALRRQRNLFSDQLPAHLQELAAAMRVGHTIVSGIAVMAEGAAEPTRGEFQRVIADEQLGMPLPESLRQVAKRMHATDMEQVALVAELHAQTGGNMAEVLDRVAESVRDRAELNRELRTLTAQARGSRWIVTAIPPVLLLIIEVVNPEYLKPLFDTGTGHFLLGFALVLMVVGSIVMGRIVRIEA